MSVRSRTAATSSSLILPATFLPSIFSSRRLEQPALGKEQLLVDPQSVPVRHAGDVVGDTGRKVSRRPMVLLRHLLRVIEVVREQAPDHRDRLVLLRTGLVPKVDVVEQELAQ